MDLRKISTPRERAASSIWRSRANDRWQSIAGTDYVVQSTGDGIFQLFGVPVVRSINRSTLWCTAHRMHDE
jgi:hypothetical protein